MRIKNILTVPPKMWKQFRETLLDTRQNGREEVIGFLFCRRHRLSRRIRRLLATSWVVPMPDCYESQSAGGLALRQDFHIELLRRYGPTGLDIVHVHTHPGRLVPDFSCLDDTAEAQYCQFLSRFSGQPRLVSCVFNEDLRTGRYRLWHSDGTISANRVFLSPHWIETQATRNNRQPIYEKFDRQKVFGREFQATLGRLRVGLAGCGGIGACFAEQLARLGVRRWVLVDPDHLETSNLNRLPAATESMVTKNWSKVRYVRRLVQLAWPGTAEVKSICAPVQSHAARRALAKCHLIVAATDNHLSRMVCQELALHLMRPLISLGTQIEASETDDSCRILSRITVPPLGGGWCLMCGNIIDANLAAMETAPSEISSSVRAAGYVPGVPAPAVYWANSCCASLGVYIIHGALCKRLDLSNGLDWVMEYGQRKWLEITHENQDNCLYCSPDGQLASAERVS